MDRGIRLALLLLFSSAAALGSDALRVRTEVIAGDGMVVQEEEPLELPGRVILEFHAPRAVASTSAAARTALLEQFRSDLGLRAAGATIRREYSVLFFGAAIDAPPEALAAIRALDYVRAIHPDRRVKAHADPEPIDARPRVNAGALPLRGNGTVVAILDTGIDYMHSALGRGLGPSFKVIGGHDFVNDDADPMDDHGHGTHVAGIVAGESAELIGVAPAARLLGYKVLSASGSGSTSDIIAAMERSVDPNGDGDRSDAADVINLSLGAGGTPDDPMARAADAAVAAGIVVVASAGNAGETASIGSPGAAAKAITVGAIDGAGILAPFSSRGPTSRVLTFKPDIVAPGVAILSARRGGGLVAASGTSMAAPHVAGVAALMLELHPEWTPEKVKAAMIGGAGSMLGTPFARGAGKVDATRATTGAILLSEAGLSFGLASGSTGSMTVSRQITVTNATAAAEIFVRNQPANQNGVVITVEPSRLELPAGGSATVTVAATVNNEISAFGDQPMMGSDIRYTNERATASFSIPWALLRAARATVTYDGYATNILAFTSSASMRPVQYSGTAYELFVKPGSSWEFLLTGIDLDSQGRLPLAIRYLIAEKQPIAGDMTVPFTRAGASVRLSFAATDAEGRLLRDLPEEGEAQRRFAMARLQFADGSWRYSTMNQARGVRDVYISPASDRYTLIPSESYIDAIAMRGFNAQYPSFKAPSQSAVLEASAASYRRARLRWDRPRVAPELFVACNAGAETRGGSFFFGASGCAGLEVDGPVVFDFFTTAEATPDAFAGFMFQTGASTTATFRGREAAIVASSEAIPPRTAPSIPDRGEAAIGSGVFFPFAFHGTTAGLPVFFPPAGFFGPFGESLRDDTVPVHWEAFDATGTRIAGGRLDPARGVIPRAATNGSRLVVRREWRHESGLTSSGTLDVTFAAAGNDLTAPTVTSMRVEGAAGTTASRLAVGSAATLHLSAGDLDHGKRMEPQPTKADATRVSYRRAGTEAWVPLALTAVDAESGSTITLGHVPAGDIYRADLTAATAVQGLIDLRVELEDLAGNRAVWTQEGALFVGGASATPSRARRVRKP